ncbi:hypothetical protein FB451DRAFT_1364454 [Mycena latifolia]|nr:hypothetical protein FB451DRAFT_1364454 [Mycena latifolia]
MGRTRCSECGAPAGSPLAELQAAEEQCYMNVAPGTRHHTLFTTNEPPGDSDLPFIHSVVSTAGARLAVLDKDISQLRDRLKQLEEEHASLLAYHTQNTAILSPLRRMPPEVLTEIFAWTLPSVAQALNRSNFDLAGSPWVLTHISSRWRAISISSPSLWSLVAINGSLIRARHLSAMVTVQIQRARTIKIHFYGSASTSVHPQVEMFQLLSEYSARWEELCLSLTSNLAPLLPTLRNRLPSLRRLWIQWESPGSQAGVDRIDCFSTAPSLVDAGIWNEYRPVAIPLCAHQLTRYQLDAPWATHQSILELALNLVEARVQISFDDEFWPDTDDLIDLVHLRRLFVSDVGALQYLRTPALQEISLYIRREDHPIRHLEPFIVRSSCHIRTLCLRGFPSADEVTEILHKLPSITKFRGILRDSQQFTTLMSQFTLVEPVGHAAVAPQLRSLDFELLDDHYLDHPAFLEMLKSRWKAEGSAFNATTLLVSSDPGPDTTARAGLDALRQQGLNLVLLYGTEAFEVIRTWTFYPSWS